MSIEKTGIRISNQEKDSHNISQYDKIFLQGKGYVAFLKADGTVECFGKHGYKNFFSDLYNIEGLEKIDSKNAVAISRKRTIPILEIIHPDEPPRLDKIIVSGMGKNEKQEKGPLNFKKPTGFKSYVHWCENHKFKETTKGEIKYDTRTQYNTTYNSRFDRIETQRVDTKVIKSVERDRVYEYEKTIDHVLGVTFDGRVVYQIGTEARNISLLGAKGYESKISNASDVYIFNDMVYVLTSFGTVYVKKITLEGREEKEKIYRPITSLIGVKDLTPSPFGICVLFNDGTVKIVMESAKIRFNTKKLKNIEKVLYFDSNIIYAVNSDGELVSEGEFSYCDYVNGKEKEMHIEIPTIKLFDDTTRGQKIEEFAIKRQKLMDERHMLEARKTEINDEVLNLKGAFKGGKRKKLEEEYSYTDKLLEHVKRRIGILNQCD